MFISPFRRYASLVALLLLMLLIWGGWYITNPKRISRMSAALLSDVLGGPVTVGSARLSFSGTLLLTSVELRTAKGPESLPLLEADQIEARFDWLSLLSGQLRATQLTAIRPKLFLIEDRVTGRWNYERLRAGSGESGGSGPSGAPGAAAAPRGIFLPVIVLREARVSWAEYDHGTFTDTGHATVDGQLAPDIAVSTMYRFQVTQRADEIPTTAPTGLDDPLVISPLMVASPAAGGAAASVSGNWDVSSNRFSAVTTNIALSDNLRRSMPRLIRSWWDEHKLRGSLAQFRMNYDQDDGLTLAADLDRVSMVYDVQPPGDGTTHTLNFSSLRGTLTFGITRPFVRVAGLKGRVLGFDFLAEGEYRGFAAESPFDFSVTLPKAFLGSDYPPIFLAIPEVQETIQRLQPHGRMDASVNLKRLSWNGRIFVDGRIDVLDGKIRYSHFPFPLTQVRGLITFDHDFVYFPKMTGMADEMPLRVSGSAGITHDNLTVDVSVAGENVVFDDRIRACLPEKLHRVFHRFDSVVRGNLVCRVQRAKLLHDPVSVSVKVDILDAQGTYDALPYRVYHATGRLALEGTQATLENLRLVTGQDQSGVLLINGALNYEAARTDGSWMHDLSLEADLPIDAALLNGLPDSFDSLTREADLRGRFSFQGKSVENEQHNALVTGVVALKNVDLKTAGGIELHKLQMTADLTADKLTVRHFTAETDEHLTFSATGTIDRVTQQATAELNATATSYPLTPLPPVLLPEDAKAVWKKYQPTGKFDADLTAHLELSLARKTFRVSTYSALLHPQAITLAHPDWPDALTDLTGTIALKPDRIDMHQMTALSKPLALAWRGTYVPSTGKLNAAGTLTSTALPTKWLAVLPEGAAAFLKNQKADAKISLDIERLDRTAADQPWDFAGALRIEKFATTGTWAFAADELTLQGKGALSLAGTLDFEGPLTGTKLSVSQRNIDTFSATLASNSALKSIALTKIAGTVADGSLEGTFNLWLDKTPRYEAKLTLADAPLTSLLLTAAATDEDKKRIGTAKVTAQLAIQEAFGDKPDRTGRGQLIVKDGTIYDVPLSLGLMQIATLRLPVSGAFNRASMNYYLRDDKITFEHILLESDGINLAGMGTLSLQDKSLAFTFVTETPKEFHLPFLSELIKATRNQLLQLSVTGNLDDPKVMPVPLSAVTKTLQALLPKKKEGK